MSTTTIKSGPWPKLLPPLGIALAIVLLAAAGAVWWTGSPAPAGDGGLGELVALTQATRVETRAVLGGGGEPFDALAARRAELASLRTAVANNPSVGDSARGLAGDAGVWQPIEGSLDALLGARERLLALHAARAELLELAPRLLVATGNVASALSPADLETNRPFLARFEVTVEALQQNLRSLGSGGASDDAVRRVGDAGQYLEQMIRGLRGEDTSLGVVPVRSAAARGNLDSAAKLFEQVRGGIATVTAGAADLSAATAKVEAFDKAADALLARYRGTSFGVAVPAGSTSRLPLLLVVAALVIAALMGFVYYRARDFRRAAELQAEQNERNQQAILRLLDELSSLADGDLTVQATVTEDITGAIADSINYAIEALRGLVATINDSSILVDAAAKQTEGTSRHLLRAAETQAKQAAAASESMARMATSIEEVSGNAERASDVARHSVEIAHKGGEAVRRTIAGMNTIRETIQDTSKRIKRLGESSQEIGNIVELIEEIAEQTNILALNASIEASRAGEASRGFAVVADEVQKLAERSTMATRKIEVLVSTIQSDTNEAVMSMERSTTDVVGGALLAENAGAALDEIEQVSHQIASLVQNISGSSKEQASVASAITKNMHVLREISSKTTESTAATSSAISKLSELASQLRKTVAGFTLPDQGGGTGVLSAARVAASLEQPTPVDIGVESAPAPSRRRQSG
ncbi:MAG TPA: methyl-accepting chemotaxis protein [Gammaproteobacteria bacterium]|nr:methyl-accepting chemotaxis protein [Gammaproteobacteria bacterium]